MLTFYEAVINVYYFRRKFVREHFIWNNKILIFRVMYVCILQVGRAVLNRFFIDAQIWSIFFWTIYSNYPLN